MWIVAHFLPTALFSLRPALATASGAQTLLVPTPYAIKMALVDVAIKHFGIAADEQWWNTLRDLDVALQLPEVLVVNKTFIKIQRPSRVNKGNTEEVDEAKAAGVYPLGPTIAFREFVQFGGQIGIAVRSQRLMQDVPLATLLSHVNYLGKRGSFFQLQALPAEVDELNASWTPLTTSAPTMFINGTLQMVDDCGAKLSWEHVNVYTTKSIKLNNDERVLRPVVLPYQLERSSYRFSLYSRIQEAAS